MRRAPLYVFALAVACTAARPDPALSTRPTTTIVMSDQGTLAVESAPAAMASARTLALPIDSAWRLLPAAFDSLGIPITTVRTADYVLGNEVLRVRRRLAGAPLSTFVSCGGSMGMQNADSYDVHISILTQLRREEAGGAGTLVVTLVEATARDAGGSAASVHCGSTGRLEDRLFRAIPKWPPLYRKP